MMLTILVSGPKHPSDRIDVYLRPLVDDLKILWKPGVLEVWDEFKHEEFTMHAMLFTTINGNLAHHNLSGHSKRKGPAYPHCLVDTCVVWLRHSKKYIFMGHRQFLGKKHPYRAMDCQFLHDLKVPSGYSSNFKRLVSEKVMKMNFNLMKCHDCHVLMTALLPVALRGIKTELVRDTVTSLCLFFNAIEQKVINEGNYWTWSGGISRPYAYLKLPSHHHSLISCCI
jgi:hypothetical protein